MSNEKKTENTTHNKTQNKNSKERPPVVVVMGHIDHGKSTLLDYIRKTNVVAGEAGGITQHISAYEVVHTTEEGQSRKITFLDTPGHAAFSRMRERGAVVADVAILVVSAEDGVKAQTTEALQTILESKIPFVVAINKIDKPDANPEKTKTDLMEIGVFLEGYGGAIPYAEISAKVGTGIDRLLELVTISADLQELSGDTSLEAEGVVIETKMDTKRGRSATLIIKNGTLNKGSILVAEDTSAPTRIVEDFVGEPIQSATFSSPILVVGWDKLPAVGSRFQSFLKKKDAEQAVAQWTSVIDKKIDPKNDNPEVDQLLIPLIIKADVAGSVEALEKEIAKLAVPTVRYKIIAKGVGPISENEIKMASSDKTAMIVGFNVKIDRGAAELNETEKIPVELFAVIYKLTEYLAEELETRRPRIETFESTGKAKLIKVFSRTRERTVAGGKVTEGKISVGSTVRILRRDFEIGRGKIIGLEQSKIKAKDIEEGNEFGVLVETRAEIFGGDQIESFIITRV